MPCLSNGLGHRASSNRAVRACVRFSRVAVALARAARQRLRAREPVSLSLLLLENEAKRGEKKVETEFPFSKIRV